MREFRIDVETDSTVQPNAELDKQDAVEFLGALSGFLAQAAQTIQTLPAIAPIVGESLKFGVRHFKAGRTLEETISKTIDQLVAQAQQQPNQAQVEQQTQIQKEQVRSEGQRELKLIDQQTQREKTQGDIIKNALDVAASNQGAAL